MSMGIAGGSLLLGIVMTTASLLPRDAAAEDFLEGMKKAADRMTGDQATSALKAANPTFKVDVVRTQTRWDYAARLTDDSRADPTKLWVLGLQASAPFVRNYSPETVNVGFTTHPNQPFVYMVSRMVVFQEGSMPTAENVLAGLRKMYGPESSPVPPSTKDGFPDLRWVFDTKGQSIGGQLGQSIATSCWHSNRRH